jgi:hypothetical protein
MTLLRVITCTLAFVSFAIVPAAAQSRLDARKTTCAVLQAAVGANGFAVIQTSPYQWDRYVTRCSIHQRDVPAYLQTQNNPQCLVGYTCAQSTN